MARTGQADATEEAKNLDYAVRDEARANFNSYINGKVSLKNK